MPRHIPTETQSLRRFGQSEQQVFRTGEHYGALSWNIFKSKRKGWELDFSRLHPVYDLLLLQEAKINFNQPIDHYDPVYSWIFGESFALDRCGSSCGVLTGSRVHPRRAFNRHGPIREPFLQTPKSTAFAYYEIVDQPAQLLVINSHFINFRQLGAFDRQLQQVGETLADHRGPVIFAGDFNTWDPRRRRRLFDTMGSHGLESVDFSNESRHFLMLDYIFTRGLRVKDAHLLHFIQSSDHLPLSMWFEIPPLPVSTPAD
ncbi:MAG: endonuclease/exonuclease/phosphatase family protein [Candidatus Sericytochromatia bacterium]